MVSSARQTRIRNQLQYRLTHKEQLGPLYRVWFRTLLAPFDRITLFCSWFWRRMAWDGQCLLLGRSLRGIRWRVKGCRNSFWINRLQLTVLHDCIDSPDTETGVMTADRLRQLGDTWWWWWWWCATWRNVDRQRISTRSLIAHLLQYREEIAVGRSVAGHAQS